MRISLLQVILLVSISYKSYSQINLVPNHSFETHTACPDGTRPLGMFHPIPWTDSSMLSCDYYHECGTGFYQIPVSAIGDEYAQDSAAYIGLATFLFPNAFVYDYREFAQVRLLDTLQAGKIYCVSYYVSLADSAMYATTELSIYFTSGGCGSIPSAYFSYSPQINNDSLNPLTNKNGWTLISGFYVATGGEQFLTIGNYDNDANTDTMFVGNAISPPSSTTDWRFAYYFIDNVSVIEMQPVVAGISSSMCPGDTVQIGANAISGIGYSWSPTSGLNDSLISNPVASPTTTTTYTLTQVECGAVQTATVTVTVRMDCDTPSVFYIPTVLTSSQTFVISGLEENSHLTVYDMQGRKVYYSENYNNEFRANSVAEGQYVIELVTSQGERIKQKLIITQ